MPQLWVLAHKGNYLNCTNVQLFKSTNIFLKNLPEAETSLFLPDRCSYKIFSRYEMTGNKVSHICHGFIFLTFIFWIELHFFLDLSIGKE